MKHQRTAKYCLEIQENILGKNSDKIETRTFDCDFCTKKFSQKSHLARHIPLCIAKYKYEIEEFKINMLSLKEEIERLKLENEDLRDELKTIAYETELRILREQNERSTSTVEEIAKQPKIQNNTNNKIMIMTPLDLSKESIKNAIENSFSHEHLTLGQKGVAQFAYNNILKDEQGKLMYVCTDPSRQIFQYKSNDGKIQKDVRATKLTKAILDSEIKQTSHKIAWDNMKDGDNEIFMQYTNFYQDIQGLEVDNSDFRKELSSLTVK
jgi:hypothetical protein